MDRALRFFNGKKPLALTCRALGDLSGESKLQEQTPEIQGRLLEAEHPTGLTVRNNHALALAAFDDLTAARELQEETLEIQERRLGSEDPNTLISRNNLAVILYAFGDLTGARKLHEQNLEIRERVLGSEHPSTTISISNLLWTIRRLNDADVEAEAHLIDKLRWLLDRSEESITSADQRKVRRYLLTIINPS